MKVGFTVGVYDVFHRGHSQYLTTAAMQCDYLVIGVMTDYWVRVQKGHDRPHDSLAQRMENVRRYGWKTIAIDTLDMSQYLQMVDIWFKSEDQKNMKPDNFNGTIWLPRTPGISTTQLLTGA